MRATGAPFGDEVNDVRVLRPRPKSLTPGASFASMFFRSKLPAFVLVMIVASLLLSGCSTLNHEYATIHGNTVSNPSLGSGGFSYDVPPEYMQVTPEDVSYTSHPKISEFLLKMVVQHTDHRDHAFSESYLFHSEGTRYLWLIHAADDLPFTFRSLAPAERALLLPAISSGPYRYFRLSTRGDFQAGYVFIEIDGHAAIKHHPITVTPLKSGNTLQAVGCTVLGDITDLISIVGFAATPEDLDAVSADITALVDSFRFGPPLR